MPRKYVRKSTRATSYSKEDLENAVKQIKDNKLTYAAASREFGIPTSTLSDRVLAKTGQKSNTLGRTTAIPEEHEYRLANCLRVLEKWGWGLSREEVLDITQEFVNNNKLDTPFEKGRPGPDWFISFCRRHNLSIKKPQPVEYLRKKMTDPFIINDYFKLLGQTLQELNLTNDPECIWNLDESSLCLDPTRTKVVGAKGAACTRTTFGSAKENITILATVNAAGRKLDPLIVYKGKYVYDQWMVDDTAYDFELTYTSSKRGWMETEIFYKYMLNVVIPGFGDKRPVLLLYDGHVSHVDDKVVALAVENNITILKLPPHTSHLLQPLDLAVFKSFKNTWDKSLVKWQRQNIGVKLRKQSFAKMFADAWQQTKPEVIRNGFKKGGIYPFNASVIAKEKFDPRAYMRFLNRVSQPKALKQLCLDALNKHIVHSEFLSTLSQYKLEHISFEELLLKQVARQPQNTNTKIANKLKRVAKGGEVVTKTYLEKQKEIEQTKEKEKEANKTTLQTKRKQTQSMNQSDNSAEPGPSGIQKKRKIKKPTNSSQILINQTEDKQCTTKKGKGIGKRTRTKENQTTVDDTKKNTKSKKSEIIDSDIQKPIKIAKTKKARQSHEESHEKISSKKRIKQLKRSYSTDTTDESVQMSVHSDSDILDAISDADLLEFDVFKELHPSTYESGIEEIMKEIDQIENKIETPKSCEKTGERTKKQEETKDKSTSHKQYYNKKINREEYEKENNKVTLLSSVKLTPENQAFYKIHSSLKLNPIEKDFDIFKNTTERKLKKENLRPKSKKPKAETSQKQKPKDEIMQTEEKDTLVTEMNAYKIGDTILVRYFKKAWRYYAGVIESIIDSNPKLYTISFYKSVNKKSGILFVVPKIKDTDNVPITNIVKEIRLLQMQESPAKYTLMDDDDAIYF